MGKMRDADVVEVCAGCGKVLEVVGGVTTDEKPEEGDISICFGCGKVTVFGEGLQRRDPTEEEQEIIDRTPEIADALNRLRRFKARQN